MLSYKTFFTWLEISLYQGLSVSTPSILGRGIDLLRGSVRCRVGDYDYVLDPVRERVPEHRFYLVHCARSERAYHGCFGDNHLVRSVLQVRLGGRLIDLCAYPQARLHGHRGGCYIASLRRQHRFLARVFWYVFPFSRVIDSPERRAPRRPVVRHLCAFCLEGSSHRGGQRFPVVCDQVYQEQDLSCRFEQTIVIYSLLMLEGSYGLPELRLGLFHL